MKKKVLVVGYGSISKKLVKLLNKRKNLDIAILRTKIKKKEKEKLNFLFKISEAVKFNPKYIFICCSANLHAYYFKKFKNLNANIFIEKPLVTKTSEIGILKKYKYEVIVGYFLRFHPAAIYIKKFIQKNITKVRIVNLEVGYDLRKWRPDRALDTTVSVNKKLGGGALFELSHEIDLATWFLGFPDQIFCSNFKISKLKMNTEDVSRIILNYNRKKIIANLNLDLIQKKYSRNIKVICDEKVLFYDFSNNLLQIDNGKNIKRVKFKTNFAITYKNQINFFIDKFSRAKKSNNVVSDLSSSLRLSNLIFHLMKSNKLKKRIKFS